MYFEQAFLKGDLMVSRLVYGIVFTLCLSSVFFAQDDSPNSQQNPSVLAADSSKVLPIPFFSAETGPQCDSHGDLYFNTGRTEKTQVVLKLTTSDGSATVFRPRDAAGADSVLLAFYVTAEPKVAILTRGAKDQPYVYLFNEKDPASADRISLDTPEGLTALTIQNFLVLPNGHILLQGYFNDKAPKDKRDRSYVAQFAPSGSLLQLSLEKAADEVLKTVVGRGAKTEAAQSKDGTTYLLEPDKVIVISPAGTTDRTMKLSPPEPGYLPDQMYMNRGRLMIGFYLRDSAGKMTKARFQLLDPSTGELIHLYQPDPALGMNLVCFSDDGLTFMRPEKGHVKLMNAPIK